MLEWLERTQFSAGIRTELWGWPLALTLHALATALTVGFILIISLRLLGLFKMIPYTVLDRLFPVFWAALVLEFVSGFMLWMSKPTQYVDDTAFVLKFSLVIVGIFLTRTFSMTIQRESAAWEVNSAVSSRGVQLATAALLLWSVVLIAGRLTAHLGAI